MSLLWLTGKSPGHASALVNVRTAADYAPRLLVRGHIVLSTCATGMIFVDGVAMVPRVTLVRSHEPIQVLAIGPEGAVWTGERLGGLHVRRVDGSDLPLTVAQGFPSMHVRALAPVDRAGARVWACTAAGAARVALATDTLQIERTVDDRDGLPTGMVAALTAREDGAWFLCL